MLEIILMTNGVRTTVHGSQTTAKLSEEVNATAKFDFTVYYGDESFENIFPKLTRVIAYDTDPNDVVFEGYVSLSKPKAGSDGIIRKEVTAIHISAMLCDACVVGFEDASGNLYTIANRLLGIYNATARPEDRIQLGTYPLNGGHPEVVHIASATCWDALTQTIVTDVDYTFRFRYSGTQWVMDIADDFGDLSKDALIYGVNLTDISQELNASELYTRIIPIGGASYIPPDKINPTMSDLSSTEGMPLTLYKYHGNTEPDASRIYIANTALESKYPVIAKVVQYDDIVATDDSDFYIAQGDLYRKGAQDAAMLTDIIEGYEATALDLARAGYDYDLIELNKMYRVVNNKLGIDTFLQVTSKKTDYSNPAKSDLTFGAVGAKASKWMSRKGKTTDQKINAVGSGSYKTTNTRMGGMSMRNQSKSQYEGESHDANTLYTVSDAGTGKVELYLGDTKISGEEGGGVEVETAVVLDSNNIHDWVATQELIEDISANTKILYGGHQKTVAVQGYTCRYSTASLDNDDADNFGTKIELDAWYRADGASVYVSRHYVIELFVNEISTSTSGGVTSDRYTFGFTISRFVPNSSTAEAMQAFYTATVTNPTDAFIVMRVNSMSFATDFTKTWSSTSQTVSTPYGYIQLNQMPITVGVLTEASPTAVTYPTIYPNGSSSSTTAFLNERGTTSNNDQYRCIPFESIAEKCFDLALTKRSEPTGGGNNA